MVTIEGEVTEGGVAAVLAVLAEEVGVDLPRCVVVVVPLHLSEVATVVAAGEDFEAAVDAPEEGMCFASLTTTPVTRNLPSSVFMRGQRADIDPRIANNSDKALVATFASHSSDPDSMPLRPDFGTEGREIKLRTNFFPVRVPKGPLYEYDVAITPAAGTSARRVKRRIYQLAEQTTTWKQANMTGKVAHDSSAKLISSFQLPQPLAIKVPYYDEDESGPPQKGGKEYTLTIKFIQEIDTSNLMRYLFCSLRFWMVV